MLLAAGFSRRFGGDKRRHKLEDGSSLLTASVAIHAAVFSHLIVVLRPGDGDLAEAVQRAAADAHVVFCPDAHQGMGHSLACGARAAAGWPYLFVALADMAWVRPATLSCLAAAMEHAGPDAVVQPVHGTTPGHPVGFGAAWFPRLAALSGDRGAKSLLARAGDRLVRVAVDDPGVLQDLDTPP